MGPEILTVAQSAQADQLAEAAGVASIVLMENAGRAIADAIVPIGSGATVTVLCGPGNNGGDGFCAARVLRERDYPVRVLSLVDVAQLKGDAAEMARRWSGLVGAISPDVIPADGIIVDALFGAGLSRPLDGVAAAVVRAMNASDSIVVAADVPSGIHGDLGRPIEGTDGICVSASRTVTFFRRKPAHLLMPGRVRCGEVTVADIGIPESVLITIRPANFANGPELWQGSFPVPALDGHKYRRGHAVVVSGPMQATGAARLAARAALRAGAGLVSLASPPDAVGVNVAQLTAVMVKPFDGAKGLTALLSDHRLNAVAIGPGCGVGAATQDLVAVVVASGASVVLDADALTSFSDDPGLLFRQLHERCVLTPHEGEFERIFPGCLGSAATRLEAARDAARQAGCTVVLKGPDTVVASTDRRAAINSNAPAYLATAGAGDVLSGIIAALLAQGMPAFEAANAGVWLHGAAAARFGPGLIAEDIPEQIPGVLKDYRLGAGRLF